MSTPLDADALQQVKLVSRPHPTDHTSIMLLCNVDLWAAPHIANQLQQVCNRYIQDSSTLRIRRIVDGEIAKIIFSNQMDVSRTEVHGWLHIRKTNNLHEFTALWSRANGNVQDVEVKTQNHK